MKFKEEYYVLVKLRTEKKKLKSSSDTKETVFLGKEDGNVAFVNDIKMATGYMTKETAFLCLRDYEEAHGYEPSGLTPLLVTKEWVY